MKFTKYFITIAFLLTGCGSNPTSNTTIETGPFVNVGPVSISATIDTDGAVKLSGSYQQTLVGNQVLGAGWEVGFETTLKEAKNKQYTLFILYEDNQGYVHQQEYDVQRPFEVDFTNEQWVKKIVHDGNGNIVVFVETRGISSPQSQPDSQPVTNPDSNNYWCDDLDGVKLKVGDKAKIVFDKVNLRSNPKVPDVWDENIVAQLEMGTSITIIDGPECAHEGTWWKVRTANGKSGWMREYISTGYLLGR